MKLFNIMLYQNITRVLRAGMKGYYIRELSVVLDLEDALYFNETDVQSAAREIQRDKKLNLERTKKE